MITDSGGTEFDRLPLQSKASLNLLVGAQPGDGGVAVPVEVVVGSYRKPRLVALAAVHGYELDGVVALHEVCREIDPARLRGTLVMIPAANPDALSAGRRTSPEDDVDLNRVFPGQSEGSVSERLAYRLFHDIVLAADMVVSFHGWPPDGVTIPYVEFADGIGDARTNMASLDAARAFGFDLLCAFRDRPGLLLPEAVRAGVPAIEAEIGGLGISTRENRQRCRTALYNLMRHMKMWPGEVTAGNAAPVVREREVLSPVDGLLRHLVDLATWVDEGQAIATICDLRGQVLAELEAPCRAVVGHQRQWPALKAGEAAATLFEQIPRYSSSD